MSGMSVVWEQEAAEALLVSFVPFAFRKSSRGLNRSKVDISRTYIVPD